jgi:hypothetical protein
MLTLSLRQDESIIFVANFTPFQAKLTPYRLLPAADWYTHHAIKAMITPLTNNTPGFHAVVEVRICRWYLNVQNLLD